MADFKNAKLTQLGKNLQVKVQTGATLAFSHIALGSGIWAVDQDVLGMTTLAKPMTTIPIKEIRNDGGGKYHLQGIIDADQLIASGYGLSEIGIIAIDPDLGNILYQVTYAENPDYIPSSADGIAYTYVLNFVLTISDTATVTITVDNASAATKLDLNSHINATGVHSATSEAISERLVIRDTEGRAKFAAPLADNDAATLLTVKNHININNSKIQIREYFVGQF